MPLCLCAFLLQGCVYYNGVYNARHFAGQAEAAERAGRRLEAADRWRSAQVHADSVISRHPNSGWVGEAFLIRGRALVALEQYGDAVAALEQADRRLESSEKRREAELALGRANLGLRRAPEALAALDSAVTSRDERRVSLALLYRGRALLLLGQPAQALEDLRRSREQEAPAERALAALALGDMAQAGALAESAAAGRSFDEAQWTLLLDSLGRAGLGSSSSRAVDRLLARTDIMAGAKARLALADAARRLQATDTAGGAARLSQALQLAADSIEGSAARLALLRLDLATLDQADSLPGVRMSLARIGERGGQPGQDAAGLVRSLDLIDTLAHAEGPRDAFWFYRGTVLRDSLGAVRLAAVSFAQMADSFPDSPWTPKGLLAAIGLDHPAADSLRALLAARYASSPYAAIALDRPEPPGAYALLEDSLERALDAMPSLEVETIRRAPAVRATTVIPAAGTPPRNAPARPTTRPTIDP